MLSSPILFAKLLSRLTFLMTFAQNTIEATSAQAYAAEYFQLIRWSINA